MITVIRCNICGDESGSIGVRCARSLEVAEYCEGIYLALPPPPKPNEHFRKLSMGEIRSVPALSKIESEMMEKARAVRVRIEFMRALTETKTENKRRAKARTLGRLMLLLPAFCLLLFLLHWAWASYG